MAVTRVDCHRHCHSFVRTQDTVPVSTAFKAMLHMLHTPPKQLKISSVNHAFFSHNKTHFIDSRKLTAQNVVST